MISLRTLMGFGLKEAYERVKKRGATLNEIGSIIDWEAFRSIVHGMYRNHAERGGRPNKERFGVHPN
jgi:hypothetical protein